MAQVVALEGLLAQRRVWKGHARSAAVIAPQPSGWHELDAALPTAGWPEAALSELLLPADGLGELHLLWPALARLSQRKDAVIALVSPPYRPYPPAWHAAGIRLPALQVIEAANPREALWATEQCLRSGACSAVLGWPRHADDRALRRLQVAAETGQALGFVFRSSKAAANPSPASLRLLLEAPGRLRVLKCRGGLAPEQPILIPALQSTLAGSRPVADVRAPTAPPGSPAPRPCLQEVLRGGLRPIAVPAPGAAEGHQDRERNSPSAGQAAGPRRITPLHARLPAARQTAPDLALTLLASPPPGSEESRPAPASPGSAAPFPHGLAPTPAQA